MTAPQTDLSIPSSTPSGTTSPDASLTAAPERKPLTFGQDAPQWAQGKTPEELGPTLAQLATLAERALVQTPVANPQPVVTSTQPPQYWQQPQYQPPPPPQQDPNDYVTAGQVNQMGQQYLQAAQQSAQQWANPAIEMAAQTNLDVVRQRNQQYFAKYGPEILQNIAQVPKVAWSIDNLDRMVKLALVPHLDELASERAAQLAAQQPALRSTGASGVPSPNAAGDPATKLSEAQKLELRRHGLTPDLIAREAANMGMPLEKWYDRYAKHSVGDIT